jgi:hypothetical protein
MTSTPQENDNDFDLERDLPVTAADIEALKRARDIPPLGFEKYLQWLSEITAVAPEGRRRISGPDTPFELYFPE